MYLSVQRTGDQWTVWYSDDGSNWTTAASFTQAMTVSAIGVYDANGQGAAHTVLVDHFIANAGTN
jgi:hypothetical protein